MKKTELQVELNEIKEKNKNLENILYAVKAILWDSQSYQHKIEEIVPAIKEKYKRTIISEGVAIGVNNSMEEENRWLKETLELLIVPEGKLEQLTKIVEERRRKQGMY